MKRIFAFVLLLVVTLTTIIPCCIVDECGSEHKKEINQDQEDNNKTGICSPFFSCTTCPGLSILIHEIETPAFAIVIKQYLKITITHHSALFYSSFWQPPRFDYNSQI